jgi:parallel beta helix pectate lyase-like protein
MQTITGGGVFTARNISDINANFAAVEGVDVWVRPQYGNNNTADGTWDKPYATMAGVSALLRPGLVIGLDGVLKEEFTCPLGVNNVTIVGNQYVPRQATTSGIANGGGATWLSPTSGTGALIKIRAQGWTLRNIYFNNSATANPCVYILTDGAGDPPTDADGAHLLIDNCILTGSDEGVHVSGGTNWITIRNSTLFGFSGSGDLAIGYEGGAGVGTLLGWRILGCRFFNNAGNITVPLSHAQIYDNLIEAGSASTIDLTGGTAPNFVQRNYFNIAAADFDPAGGVTGVTGDAWSNYLTDAVETGLPAN